MKQPNVLTPQLARIALGYIARGILRLKQGHIPPGGHLIPADFMGVCIASNDNPATDDYVITQVRELGINQVRLDFTYGDMTGFNARFLQRLTDENLQVHLHLVQPFEAARTMHTAEAQNEWRQFLQQLLDQFGAKVARVEIGSTINRKRWAGYAFTGFLQAWEIAHAEIKARNIILAGPSITDFEPLYNIGILHLLKHKQQLPEIHTNNLFSERVSEPERFDHRILKYRWATRLKYNLVKKARLLQKISLHFGVKNFMSPAAFWAIYRIERMLPDGAQKQADYAARYMLLCAASGALRHAYWGTFICHREGLIDDGLKDADYPALERIAHYRQADGQLENYRHQPSFKAFRQVASLIQGARYIAPIATANGLEIHAFENKTHWVHAAWTINGKAAFVSDIYDSEDLLTAECIERDGMTLTQAPHLVTESPIYLRWEKTRQVKLKEEPQLAKDLAIHRHIAGRQYYAFQEEDWRGLILASSADEAAILAQQLHPEKLQAPEKQGALRHARNAIWVVPDPRNPEQQLTIKQPIKMYPHKQWLDRYKPSKAKRSWNGAVELLRRGIDSAQPIAFFEKRNDHSLRQNFYICEFFPADCSVGEMFIHFAQGEKAFAGYSDEEVYSQLARHLRTMHGRGTFFRDLSGGNILVRFMPDKKLHFSLIDTARARFYNHAAPFNQCISDMTRICNKLHWAGRERLMGYYLGGMGRKFGWKEKLPFYLYDLKVWLKRRIGRKGIKKIMKKFKN